MKITAILFSPSPSNRRDNNDLTCFALFCVIPITYVSSVFFLSSFYGIFINVESIFIVFY